MEAVPSGAARRGGARPLAAVILGNDTVVAARPAGPAQLVRACTAAGFDIVAPPSWGDELVASAYLEALVNREESMVVACACSRVAALLDAVAAGSGPPPRVVVVPPPVAAARYLRHAHGESLHITYVGDCPNGNDASIDAWLTPAALFARFTRAGISLDGQPSDVHTSDDAAWSRHTSMPGGLPALRYLARKPVSRVLRVLDAVVLDAWATATSRSNILADLSDVARCACGGDRDRVEASEPPRASSPIILRPPALDLTSEPTAHEPTVATQGAAPAPPASHGTARAASGRTRRGTALATLPLAVLASIAALGIGAYATGSRGEARRATRAHADAGAGATRGGRTAGGEAPSGDSAVRTVTGAPAAERRPAQPGDSAAAATRGIADSARRAASDSVATNGGAAPRRRPRRATGYRVVPGWLPQGRSDWTPLDTSRARKRDTLPVAPAPARPDTGGPPT